MPRKPSPATIVKRARTRILELEREVKSLKQQRDTYQANLLAMKDDRDEWKKRFDKLLERLSDDPL